MNKKLLVVTGVLVAAIATIVFIVRDTSAYAKDFRNGVFVKQEKALGLSDEERSSAQRRFNDFRSQRENQGTITAYLGEAQALVDLGQNGAARDLLKEAEKVFNKEAEFYEGKGDLLAAMRQFKDAAVAYEKAVILDPTFFRAYLSLVELYQSHSRFSEKSELVYEQALASGADGREVLINYASFLEVQKMDYTKALEMWERAREKATSESERAAIELKINELHGKLNQSSS